MTTPPTTPPAEPVKVPDAVQEHIDRLGWMLRSIVDLAESERQTLNFAIDRLSAPAVPLRRTRTRRSPRPSGSSNAARTS